MAVYPAQFPRHQETFPALTKQEIDRLRRYGSIRKYSDGEKLFEAGKVSPGMFVVLKGLVALTQRDGLGHVTPIVEQGEGQFLADVGQLSNSRGAGRRRGGGRRRDLVDSHGRLARAPGR